MFVCIISKHSLTLQNQLDLPRDIAVISHPHSQFNILSNLATNWVAAHTFRARTRVTMLSRWGMDFAIIIFEINEIAENVKSFERKKHNYMYLLFYVSLETIQMIHLPSGLIIRTLVSLSIPP